MVSKYIGETEKKLAALVDQDRSRSWVLLFDEAGEVFDERARSRTRVAVTPSWK